MSTPIGFIQRCTPRSLALGITLLATAVVTTLLPPPPAAAQREIQRVAPSAGNNFPGAIYTTDSTGTVVNQNLYAQSTDVYLNGGPQNSNFSGLPDGTYYFQVTDPSGRTLLSSDPARCRQLKVVNGRVFGAAGPCPHNEGAFNPANNSKTVQLSPFAQTPNSGGEYKAWLIRQTGTTSVATDGVTINFAQKDSKTDNFKVHEVNPGIIASCLPTSSLSVLIQGCNVSAYVPRGSWSEPTTGVKVVTLEGTGPAPTIIPTPNAVNSCASNSVTGETVCASNGTDVYLITGTTLNNTLTSGATGSQNFSGGNCMTCGVAMDASTNQAILAIGVAVGGPGGFQFVDLGTSTPGAVVPAGAVTSEDISVDPVRHLVLSPNEQSNYQIMQTQPTPTLFDNITNPPQNHELDSACEDCLTGIALATDEFTTNLFLTDLNQATFTPGSPRGTWSTPAAGSNLQNFPEFGGLFAGTSGIAIAPGSHLGIVAGEFGGSDIGVIQLPAAAGGTPTVIDWVAATTPNDPSNVPWSMGLDPHTVTAYVSPCTGKAIGVMSNADRSYLALVDLQCLLSGARAGHVSTAPASCITYVALPPPNPMPADSEEPVAIGPRGKQHRPTGNQASPVQGDPSPVASGAPKAFQLNLAITNPFHSSATMGYSLSEASHAKLAVYDVSGRLMKVLVDQDQAAGSHAATWDGTDANGTRVKLGVYFYTLRAGTHAATQKVVMGR